MIEIKELRNHDCKHFVHPTDPTKRICRQSSGLLHALTDEGFKDIETELPDYNFPEATPFETKEDKHFIMDLPSWGTPVLEDDGKTLKVLDKSGKSIYRYRDLTALPKGDKPYVIATKDLEMKLVDNLSQLEDGDIVGKNKNAKEGQFHAENGKMYVKFDESVKYPIDVFDSTDTSSTNNKDSMMDNQAGNQDTNYGSLNNSYVCDSNTYKEHMVISFTTPNITGTISDCRLKVMSYADSETTQRIHQLSANTDWVENQVTWNSAKSGVSWTTPGGDYNSTIIDEVSAPVSGNAFYFQLQGTGADNPLTMSFNTAYHFLIKSANNSSSLGRIQTKEASTAGNRPYLEITYGTGTTYTLAATAGSFSLTGVNTGLLKNLKLICSAGSYVLTGVDILINKAISLTASVGSYIFTGGMVSFLRGKIMSVSVGVYELTGVNIDVHRVINLITSAGSYALTGINVLFNRCYCLTTEVGTFILTGIDVLLGKFKIMSVAAGSYVVTGVNILIKILATLKDFRLRKNLSVSRTKQNLSTSNKKLNIKI
jgi:hypothetical protein